MGLDRNNIPEEYLCEVCKPRPVDRKRAKALQSRRKTELFNNSSSSDDNHPNKLRPFGKKTKRFNGPADRTKTLQKKVSSKKLSLGGNKKFNNREEKTKKQYRKRKPSDKSGDKSKVTKRGMRKSLDDDLSGDELSDDDSNHLYDSKMDASQQLRSWIDQYEEAVTNHYSPELRSRLTGNKLPGLSGDLRVSVIGAPVKCNVSLKGNGVKVR